MLNNRYDLPLRRIPVITFIIPLCWRSINFFRYKSLFISIYSIFVSLMTLKSSTKILFFFETANITLSFLLFSCKICRYCFRKHSKNSTFGNTITNSSVKSMLSISFNRHKWHGNRIGLGSKKYWPRKMSIVFAEEDEQYSSSFFQLAFLHKINDILFLQSVSKHSKYTILFGCKSTQKAMLRLIERITTLLIFN